MDFNFDKDIVFDRTFLPFHANGLRFDGILKNGEVVTETFYSIGGGFVVKEERENAQENKALFKAFPHAVKTGNELLQHCLPQDKSISEIVWENELSLRTAEEIDIGLQKIWGHHARMHVLGVSYRGEITWGLNVKRRALTCTRN